MSVRSTVLTLYKRMLRESAKWPNYSYRNYAQRKIRDTFRAKASLSQGPDVEKAILEGERNLALIQRQMIVGLMYRDNPIVIDNHVDSKPSS